LQPRSVFSHLRCRSYEQPQPQAVQASLLGGLTLAGPALDAGLGSVFNVLHHPSDGRTLLAMYERRALARWDFRVGGGRPVFVNRNAHEDCVNVAAFLGGGDCVFATGCDSGQCRVWDLRRPGRPLAVLSTEAGCIKNLECAPASQLLMVSGFRSQLIFYDTGTLRLSDSCPAWSTSQLMRARLHPDSNRLVLAYRSFLVLIDRFDPETLASDLPDFQPDAWLTDALDEEASDVHIQTALLALQRRVSDSSEGLSRNLASLVHSGFNDRPDTEEVSLSSLCLHPSGCLVASRGFAIDLSQPWRLSQLLAGPAPVSCSTYLHWLQPGAAGSTLIGQFEEPIAARQIIKEISFSGCRRFLASPFARGVRLFANGRLDWLERTGSEPVRPVATVLGTGSSVVTTDFSPVHELQLAVGTTGGAVHLVEPRF
uniref:WD_REPEATS_REGION domain-containing protein n=2 Tax=Macrostomum lignano TaxID=282301 RepID=A0A1I8H2Z6_9PLAT